jgi:subtilisin family serine protease
MCPTVSFADSALSIEEQMAKLDSGLRYIAATGETTPPQVARSSCYQLDTATGAPRANVMVEVLGDGDTLPAGLVNAGFVLHTRAGTVVTGDVPINLIPTLENIPGLKRAEAARTLSHELDAAIPETLISAVHNAMPPRRGARAIVGIIDHGIDYRHRSFRKNDGTSRILAIWDQSLKPEAEETSPAPFNYGVEYLQEAINSALRSAEPLLKVRHADVAPFHGTHVAGIAAGGGQPPDGGGLRFVGAAPDADLILVANTRGQAKNPGSFGDSADTLDAVQYILQIAANLGRPVAINLSQGDNIGPHDGTSLLEVGIANLITGAGRALINSAGNEGHVNRHAQSVLTDRRPQDVSIKIPPNEHEVIVDIWYPGTASMSLAIIDPDGRVSDAFRPPFSRRVPLSNGNEAFVDADLHDPGNGDNRTFTVLRPGNQATVQEGVWILRLDGDGPWHAWIQRNSGATFQAPFASQATTVSIPGTCSAVITVGSYINTGVSDLLSLGETGTLSNFSSRGPTRDGRRAPTLSAPGDEITAPQPDDRFGPRHGTSMAAALVTGTVALMLDLRETMTASEIKETLERTARTMGIADNDFGMGKLDAKAACHVAVATHSGTPDAQAAEIVPSASR